MPVAYYMIHLIATSQPWRIHPRPQAGASSAFLRDGVYLSNPAFRSEGLTYYLALLTPNAHAFDGYLKLMLHSGDIVDILPNMLALVGFGVVFFLIGVWRFKYE